MLEEAGQLNRNLTDHCLQKVSSIHVHTISGGSSSDECELSSGAGMLATVVRAPSKIVLLHSKFTTVGLC